MTPPSDLLACLAAIAILMSAAALAWAVRLLRPPPTAAAGAARAHAGNGPATPPPFHLALASAAASARSAAASAAGLTLAELCAHFPARGEAPFTVDLKASPRPTPRWWWSPRRAHPRSPAAAPAVAAAATAAAAASLLRNGATPKHAPTYATLDALVGCGGGTVGLLTAPATDDAWRSARRAAAPALGPAGVTARWSAIAAAADAAAALVTPGLPVNLDDLATRAALDGAAALVFGVEAGATQRPGSDRRAGPTGADALLASLSAGLVEVDARWAAASAAVAPGEVTAPPAVSWWGVRGSQGRPSPPPPRPPLPGPAALTTFHACVRRLVGESLAAATKKATTASVHAPVAAAPATTEPPATTTSPATTKPPATTAVVDSVNAPVVVVISDRGGPGK